VTILIGLPLGRVRSVKPGTPPVPQRPRHRHPALPVWDVLVHAFEPVDIALGKLHDGKRRDRPGRRVRALFFLGITVGLGSLVLYEGWLGSKARRSRRARGGRRREVRGRDDGGGRTGRFGRVPGTGHLGLVRGPAACRLLIASASGCTTSARGWPSAAAAAAGDIGLATILVIGFALHNGTEGFGIVAPLGRRR
jgi:ZIP family zinc transporter